jgi:hypothetical protein
MVLGAIALGMGLAIPSFVQDRLNDASAMLPSVEEPSTPTQTTLAMPTPLSEGGH